VLKMQQYNRLFHIDTPFGEDKVVVRHFHGKESISGLFQYDVELITGDFNLDPDAVVGKPVKLKICQSDEKSFRYFNGYVCAFHQMPSEGQLAVYRMRLVPWLWFLSQTSDCFIHQELSLDKVIRKVFDKYGMRDYEFQLRMQHEAWEYCIQYRESAFAFISRLMEMEGMFYFWKQEEGRHVMMIGDGANIHQPCQFQSRIKMERAFGRGFKRMEDSIFSFQGSQKFKTGKYTYRDYNFMNPDSNLHGETNARVAKSGKDKYEIYDFPGEYESQGEANPFTRLRMEETESDEEEMEGTSCARSLMPGYKFDMSGHDRREYNQTYMVLEVEHEGSEENYIMEEEEKPPKYENKFKCMPADVPYRPERKTPKHIMRGVQTATVVGPKGEEIYTDKYGRVKVQFHWDREGKKDENSSCWIRVSQGWAGKNFGAMFLPRIGQEVLVDFIESDPDRPIITGRVYNAANMPAYELPKNKNWSGIRSRSTKGGGTDNFNELRFDDTKGQELFWMHAEKDMRITVEHDTNEVIDNDRFLLVKDNQIEQVNKDKHVTVDKNEYRETTGNKNDKVGGNLVEKVGGNVDSSISGNLTASVSGSVGLNYSSSVQQKVGTSLTVESGMETSFKAGMKTTIEAGMELTLKAAGGFIKIDPSGVYVNGMMLYLNSGGAGMGASGASPGSPQSPEAPKKPPGFGGEAAYVTTAPAATTSTAAAASQAKVRAAVAEVPPPPALPGTPGYAPLVETPKVEKELEAKKARVEFRADLLKKSKARAPELKDPVQKKNVESAIQRFERNNKAADMAQLADHVYNPDKEPPVGWEKLSGDALPPALKDATFSDPKTGFGAALYKSKIDGKVALAFKGTNPANKGDIMTDMDQAMGLDTEQYKQAVELAKQTRNAYPQFDITGHSLGGGLGQAAAAKTGQTTTVFNAAGLSPSTVERAKLSMDAAQKNVTNFRVAGEALTSAQEGGLAGKIGSYIAQKALEGGKTKSVLNWAREKMGMGKMPDPDQPVPKDFKLPPAVGKQVDLPAVDDKGNPDSWMGGVVGGARHKMGMVINGIEKEKRDDMETLANSL